MDRPDWDSLFMATAFLTAMRSPDAETKHGAVVVDNTHRILGTGFNGFPRGCRDDKLPNLRPHKYPYVIHAEVNALINCGGLKSPQQCTIYVTGEPCNECFKLIVQHQIGRIVYAGVGSKIIDSNTDHTLIRQALSDGLTIEIEPYRGGMESVIKLLEQAAAYCRSRG